MKLIAQLSVLSYDSVQIIFYAAKLKLGLFEGLRDEKMKKREKKGQIIYTLSYLCAMVL